VNFESAQVVRSALDGTRRSRNLDQRDFLVPDSIFLHWGGGGIWVPWPAMLLLILRMSRSGLFNFDNDPIWLI
jgi:hypothetical protein